MAAEARKRTAPGGAPSAPAARPLRRLDEPLSERRFDPKDSLRAVLAVTAMSLGGVGLGVGVYGQWMRSAGPWGASPYLMAAGVALFVGYWFFGRDIDGPLRVGDLGVAAERDARTLERILWCDVDAIAVKGRGLEVKGAGKTIALSLARHGKAAARLIAEAAARIPDKLTVPDAVRASVGRPQKDDAPTLSAEPPQVVDEHCRASDKPLTIEKDVRMCARCVALYHKAAVPRRCVVCHARLKT